jgi:hypothetical protein
MPRILTAAEAGSYRITAIPNNPATIVVAMIAERRVKRRPRLRDATPARARARARARAKIRDAYQWGNQIKIARVFLTPAFLASQPPMLSRICMSGYI